MKKSFLILSLLVLTGCGHDPAEIVTGPQMSPVGSGVRTQADPSPVTPRMRTNSGDTCRVAALRNQGIVLQPTFLVGPDLLAGTLVEVMPAWRSVELGVYALYPSRKFVSPKVRLMIEFLVNAFRVRAWPA